ncbi:hypothetical protein ANCCAN_20302 [Ancylostoma caninum]|uniref:Lysozyme n=1 Tax=Ancylostoma caninum TaxID=29170 RepID=A0A368FS49_ANCCA|nr:hypothetical protein ANCCAN_20302 [Ancylostoma caninum]
MVDRSMPANYARVLFFAIAACLAGNVAAGVEALYALDIATPLTEFDARCLKICRYSALFLRAYSPFVSDGFEASVCGSFQIAKKAGFGIELYMIPFSPNPQDAARQFDRLYNGLRGCQILAQRIWLVKYGIEIGIYTNEDDWSKITNGYPGLSPTPLLWYWNVKGTGPMGETPMNFDDFRPFASWKVPTVKQFGQQVFVCGHKANRDTYFARQTSTNTVPSGNVSYAGDIVFQ